MHLEESRAEYNKMISVPQDVYEKILSLKKENQTCGDVVAMSLDALEEKRKFAEIPCIDDKYIEEHEKEWDEAENDFDNRYISLEDSVKQYRLKHKEV
ncbi:MAG: hypothetical protein Q4Q53_07615 [Methanocorpusculum sp.]|nr:hypothetical protein [Methanocorpusculum sp.]